MRAGAKGEKKRDDWRETKQEMFGIARSKEPCLASRRGEMRSAGFVLVFY